MDQYLTAEAGVALLTLTVLEVVLGIDNIVFISILAGKLPRHQQKKARQTGLMIAMVTRVLLLLSLTFIMKLVDPLFSVLGREISGKDIILISGGLFLLAKSTHEIHQKLEGEVGEGGKKTPASFTGVVIQILILDVIFSLDSVITAVGMAGQIGIMVLAVIIAVGIMLVAAGAISNFVNRHPTVKMLALSFLILIGVALLAEGFHQHIEKGYIYFAMGFSVGVEMLNLRMKAKAKPVVLHEPYVKS